MNKTKKKKLAGKKCSRTSSGQIIKMNLLTIPRTFLKVEENVKNEGILSPVSEMVADGALLSFNGTETHHITPRERERERKFSSTLPGCCVRVDEKLSKKEK